MALLVYADDVFLASNDATLSTLKSFLNDQFKLNDLGVLKYFPSLEIGTSVEEISVCQCIYAFELFMIRAFLVVDNLNIQGIGSKVL